VLHNTFLIFWVKGGVASLITLGRGVLKALLIKNFLQGQGMRSISGAKHPLLNWVGWVGLLKVMMLILKKKEAGLA